MRVKSVEERRRLAVWLSGCLVVWPPGCLAVWLSGCLAVWLSGCLVAWLSGCLAAWLAGRWVSNVPTSSAQTSSTWPQQRPWSNHGFLRRDTKQGASRLEGRWIFFVEPKTS